MAVNKKAAKLGTVDFATGLTAGAAGGMLTTEIAGQLLDKGTAGVVAFSAIVVVSLGLGYYGRAKE